MMFRYEEIWQTARQGYSVQQLRGKTQIIQHAETFCDMFSSPRYITENNNGDVEVSDSTGAVVVTDREGIHRF